MAVPNEGTNVLPSDGQVPPKFFLGWFNDADGFFYAPRTDNLTAKNLKVALYDATAAKLMPDAAAMADAMATPTTTRIGAELRAWNGSTSDRVRQAADSMALPGVLGAAPLLWDGSAYNRARSGSADGDAITGSGAAQVNVRLWSAGGTNYNRWYSSSIGTGIPMVAEPDHSFLRILTATTTTVKSGAGILKAIIVGKHVAAAAITIYDNTAASGTVICVITPGAALLSDPPITAQFDLKFATGLTIVTAGASDITVVYR